MKILHIITGLGTGGAERMLVKLIKSEVDGKRHEVITLTDLGTQGDILIAMGINVHVLRIKNILVPLHILKYMIFIKKHRFDVIQGWMYHGNVVAFLFSLINKKKVLLFNIRHSLHPIKNEKTSTRIVININKLITKYATYIVYNSDISRLQHESFGYKCNNALVVYNGFDPDVFKKNTKQKNITKKNIILGKIKL